jgi:polyisoprenoid-binding protein YceI
MKRACGMAVVMAVLILAPLAAAADPIAFKVLSNPSRVTFKSEAPLETFVGTVAGEGLTGTVTADPAKPQATTGQIKVDLEKLNTGIAKRDADMRGKDFLNTEAGEANRYAIFDIKSIELAGPLEPGKETPAKVHGTLTVKGKPANIVADSRVTYVKLAPDVLEQQKRFGFTNDNIRVKAKFDTKFTNHDMQVPQLLFLKVNNNIELEADLTLIRQ